MEAREFTQLAQTEAWNFQQGAMLSWNPANSDEIIYNVFEDGKYKAAIKNLKNNTVRYMDRPVANVSPDGKWGLSVNMNRIYDFRPGYGYCNIEDPWKNVNTPAEDGVFLVNMETGTSNQIISYDFISPIRMHPLQEGKNSKGLIAMGKTYKKKAFYVLQEYYRNKE